MTRAYIFRIDLKTPFNDHYNGNHVAVKPMKPLSMQLKAITQNSTMSYLYSTTCLSQTNWVMPATDSRNLIHHHDTTVNACRDKELVFDL
jgi:hypothetical protein